MHLARRHGCLWLAGLLAGALCLLGGCSPLYVGEAVYRESAILLNRRKITDVISDAQTAPEQRRKLALVLEARAFAEAMGLTPKGAFSYYTRVDCEVLAWVLAACQKDRFSLHTWWFPFVGRVPYKGYFDREDAEVAGRTLEGKGFEVWLRPTDAFSTLGWFDDPVLSTTLARTEEAVVQTVIHESLHSTLWLPDRVEFNESLANFVGLQGTIDLYSAQAKACLADGPRCPPEKREAAAQGYRQAQEQLSQQLALAGLVAALYQELNALYESDLSRAEKLARREVLFNNRISALPPEQRPRNILQAPNNAEIIQLKLYLSNLGDFQELYAQSGGAWQGFLDAIRKVMEDSGADDPFDRLKAKIST